MKNVFGVIGDVILTFGGKELKPDKKLSDYHITKFSNITIALLPNIKNIVVQTVDREKECLSVDINGKCDVLIEKAKTKFGVTGDEKIVFTFAGKQLDPQRKISFYGINKRSELCMVRVIVLVFF